MAKVKLAHDLRRGQGIRVKVESLANGGDGVAKSGGLPIFVERAATGDELEVELFDVRKDFARGAIKKILSPSPARVKPPCRHFERCGGCQWQHIDYQAQLKEKEDLVRQALKHIGGIKDGGAPVETICGATPGGDLHYRNKAQFPVQYVDGKFLAGYYGRGSHDLVDVEQCEIQPQAMDRVLETVRQLLKTYKLHAYDETTRKGLVRHVNLRQSAASGGMLATVVLNHAPARLTKFEGSPELSPLLDLAAVLMERHGEIEGVLANFNPGVGNRILGEENLLLAGREYVEEVLKTERTDLPQKLRDGLKLRLSSGSFFQVNTAQALAMLEIIAEMVQSALAGIKEPVIGDAYAGVGTMALFLAPLTGRVVAIEENAGAVADGVANGVINGITNVEFVAARVEEELERLADEGLDLLLVDPPRKGLSPEVLAAVKERGPQHLVYVSCNPTTLARDLRLLEDRGEKGEANGYKTKRIKPVDLFPHTYHVETVVLLERF